MSYDAKRDVKRIEKEEDKSRSEETKQHHEYHRNKRLGQVNQNQTSLLANKYEDLANRVNTLSKKIKPFPILPDFNGMMQMISATANKVVSLSSKIKSLESSLKTLNDLMLSNTQIINALSSQKKTKMNLLENKISSLEQISNSHSSQLVGLTAKERRNDRSNRSSILSHGSSLSQLGYALSGNIWFNPGLSVDGYISESTYDIEIDGYDLNNAEANSYKKLLSVSLCSANEDGYLSGIFHNWANFGPIVVTSESVSDPDVSSPVVLDSTTSSTNIRVSNGVLSVNVIFDTDNNATKHYTAGDYMEVTFKISGDDYLNGIYIKPLVIRYLIV